MTKQREKMNAEKPQFQENNPQPHNKAANPQNCPHLPFSQCETKQAGSPPVVPRTTPRRCRGFLKQPEAMVPGLLHRQAAGHDRANNLQPLFLPQASCTNEQRKSFPCSEHMYAYRLSQRHHLKLAVKCTWI